MEYVMKMSSLSALGFNIFAGLFLPIALFFVFWRWYQCSWRTFLAGCSAMVLLELLVEFLISKFLVAVGLGEFLQSNRWLYGLSIGLVAGVIQEPLRYVYMRFFITEEDLEHNNNAMMFGAGYGGLNAATAVIMNGASNFAVAYLIYNGQTDSLLKDFTGEDLAMAQETLQAMCEAPMVNFLMVPVEFCLEAVCQIGLSVLTWFAMKSGRESRKYLFIAMGLHFLQKSMLSIVGSYYSNGVVNQILHAVIAAGIVFAAYKAWDDEATVTVKG